MQLRSGKTTDKFENVLGTIDTIWPTLKQARMLSLKTKDADKLTKHIKLLLSYCKTPGIGSIRNELAFLAVSESILASESLQPKWIKMLQVIRDKLFDVKSQIYEFDSHQYTLKIINVIIKNQALFDRWDDSYF